MGTMVPMISPDGQSGDVPAERVQDAVNAGFKTAVVMTSPDGQGGYIPHDRAMDAIKAGFKLGQPGVQKFMDARNPDNQPGFLHSAASELGDMAKSIPQMAGSFLDPTAPAVAAAQMGAKMANEDERRKSAGRSGAYRAVALAGTPLGINAAKMEDQADVGNARGVLGTAAADAAPVVAAEAVKAAAPSLASLRDAAKAAFDERAAQRIAKTVQSVIPEARNLPAQAISGVEDIFRAAAPTGTKVGFRGNLYAAAPDLADIGKKIDAMPDASGGIVKPDLRVRQATDAIGQHLDEMYQTERAPQIQRNAGLPVNMNLGPDALEGLQYLKRSGATAEIRSIAASALEEGAIPMADADKIAIPTNQMLKGFESMTPAERAQTAMTNRRLGSLKALDVGLGNEMNSQLQAAGEEGLRSYERRYAALSEIKQQLERRTNAVELNQPGIIKGLAKPLVGAVSGGPSGIASASQAAVADVNIGRMLQNGFSKLKGSGISRPTPIDPSASLPR